MKHGRILKSEDEEGFRGGLFGVVPEEVGEENCE